jgi:hypothetical protein
MSILLKQHLNTHKQQLRALGLQIIIHQTHTPVHKQSHRLTVTTNAQRCSVRNFTRVTECCGCPCNRRGALVALPAIGALFVAHLAHQDWHRLCEERVARNAPAAVGFAIAFVCDLVRASVTVKVTTTWVHGR